APRSASTFPRSRRRRKASGRRSEHGRRARPQVPYTRRLPPNASRRSVPVSLRLLTLAGSLSFAVSAAQAATPVLVIHGGAGVVKADLTPEKETLVRADLERALDAGYAVLKNGGDSL